MHARTLALLVEAAKVEKLQLLLNALQRLANLSTRHRSQSNTVSRTVRTSARSPERTNTVRTRAQMPGWLHTA